jgi:Trypsin
MTVKKILHNKSLEQSLGSCIPFTTQQRLAMILQSVRPVSLSFDRDFPKPGVITNIFGYGTKSANENELSDKLMETTLSVLDTSICQDIYGANNVVRVTQICAGGAGKVRTELYFVT